MIFIVFALLIGALLMLFNADLHRTIFAKFVSQNAGDSAALSAARWQGATLNLIGDLNVLKAVAVSGNDNDTVNTLTELQKRLNYVGPMAGLAAAQQAAKNNGIFVNPDFTSNLVAHSLVVRTEYPVQIGDDGQLCFPEPWEGAWDDYADMIELVAKDGVAAGPDNAHYYTDFTGGHMLLNPDFYNAIAGYDWCWFLHHAMDLLQTYDDFNSWPALPPQIPHNNPINCEYFGLGLVCNSGTVSDIQLAAINTAIDERHPGGVSEPVTSTQDLTAAWFMFDPAVWIAWTNFSPDAGFPSKGTIKSQYDYVGADAVVRIQTEFDRLTPGVTNAAITWTAAAKPFGCLTNSLGSLERPDTLKIVLPVFSDVRIFPVDVSTAPVGGAFNLAWRVHIEKHLPGWTDDEQVYHPGYMQDGPSALDLECFYCRQLARWDDWGAWDPPDFRGTGLLWLSDPNNVASCQIPSGGDEPGGGTSHGH